jgi:hypothetical protein
MADERLVIPAFEGRPVAHVITKVGGTMPTDDLKELVLGIDDVVQIRSLFRVANVHHNVDTKTGEITRVQVIKPVEANLLPLDPSDPSDDGVLRSLPYVAGQVVGGDPKDVAAVEKLLAEHAQAPATVTHDIPSAEAAVQREIEAQRAEERDDDAPPFVDVPEPDYEY